MACIMQDLSSCAELSNNLGFFLKTAGNVHVRYDSFPLCHPADLEIARESSRGPFVVEGCRLISWEDFSNVLGRNGSLFQGVEEEGVSGRGGGGDSVAKRFKADASCIDLKETVFYGDVHSREKVSVDLEVFFASFLQHLHHGASDLLSSSGLNLYISQSAIADYLSNSNSCRSLTSSSSSSAGGSGGISISTSSSSSSSGGDDDGSSSNSCNSDSVILPFSVHLPDLYQALRCPAFLKSVKMHQINLWMNIAATECNVHFDSHDNLLFVVKGRKHVVIIGPGNKLLRQSMNHCHSSNGNHSKLTYDDCLAFEKDEIKADCWQVTVEEGEALFIPNGFWHAVKSEPCTIGINYWFFSMLQRQLDSCLRPQNKGMDEFALRYLVSSMVEKRIKENANAMRLKCRSKFAFIFTASYDVFELFLLSVYRSVTANNDCNSPTSNIAFTEVLLGCNITEMITWWPMFAEKYPKEWHTAFFSLYSMPESVTFLLTYWSEIEESLGNNSTIDLEPFYVKIYSCLSFSPTEIRQHMVSMQDKYAKITVNSIIELIL